MKTLKAKGVTIHQWSPEILAAFKTAWEEVVVEESAKSPEFKQAYDTYTAFRKEYRLWADNGYIKE